MSLGIKGVAWGLGVLGLVGCGLGLKGLGFRDFSSHVLQRFFETFACVAVALIVAAFVVAFCCCCCCCCFMCGRGISYQASCKVDRVLC